MEENDLRKKEIKDLDKNIKIAKTLLLIDQGFEFDDICMMSDLPDSEILRIIKEHEEESK